MSFNQSVICSPASPAASLWADLVANYGPYKVEFVGTLLVQVLFFWLPSAIYISLDSVFPDFSARHKIQPAPKQPTAAEIRHCATIVLRNQLISLTIASLNTFVTAKTRSPSPLDVSPSLPPVSAFARDVVLCLLLREALFYYSHRLLHWPPLYRAVHKTHHRFVAPVALAAQYAHPLEHLVANVLPVALPPVLLHAHVLSAWTFLALELLETSTVHSGYDFFAGAARMHDRHHERFNVNFGALGFLDWVHGTDGREKKGARKGKKD